MTRALTRLKSIFINMDKLRGYENVQANGGTTYKTFNDFFHSMGALPLGQQVYDPALETEIPNPKRIQTLSRIPDEERLRVFLSTEENVGDSHFEFPQCGCECSHLQDP